MTAGPSVLEQQRFAYEPGDVIAGKYALEQLLGSGGMGAVFRARNTVIDMPVAIKLIRADLDRDLFSGRLLQEARAAAKLSHPAIVRVFDVGQTALGDPFIVMELLEGEALSATIEREGRLTSVRAVQLLLPIADALSMAHSKGFVHRDVKPDNVFIASGAEGQLQPKLVDFGIVKQDADSHDLQSGAVVGSPDYMSPEQARGLHDIDSRSDVWSFSVVLYESIYGRAPFDGDNYQVLMENVVRQEPVTLRELSVADETLSRIVAKGMSKEPAERWQTLGQMGKALAHWLHEEGVNEDACGASLESRWLSRSTDPSALARAARTSSPESWPEPPSGVRAVGKLGFAPTVRVSKSGTPHALSQTSAPPPSQKKRVTLALGASALALSAIGGAFFWSQSRHEAATPAAVTSPVKVAPEARPEVQPLPEVTADAPSAAPPAASASVVTPVKRRPIAAPARRPQRKKSSSDLLAPY
jgi:serine/threonine-protein kinase